MPVISPDAEQAFDQIEWMGTCLWFCACPTAAILTNGNRSLSLNLNCGTRPDLCCAI